MILFRNDPFIRFVDEFFESKTEPTQSGFVNVHKSEDDKGYELKFIVPGLTKNDVTIIIEEDLLKVSYEKPEDLKGFVGSFERTYSLPDDINDKKIEAKVENGILGVKIPKMKKKNSQRTISIN